MKTHKFLQMLILFEMFDIARQKRVFKVQIDKSKVRMIIIYIFIYLFIKLSYIN